MQLSVSFPEEMNSTARSKKLTRPIIAEKEPVGGNFEARLLVREQIRALEKDKKGLTRLQQQVEELKKLRDRRERKGSGSPRSFVKDNRSMM